MAEALSVSLRENPDVRNLLDLLSDPRYKSQRQEFSSILDYVDTLSEQYNAVMTKLDTMSEKLSGITDRKNPLSIMAEHIGNVVSGIGEKLKAIKDSIIGFAKDTLEAARDKGLSALGAVSETLHISEGLDAISKGLDKAAARCENLEHFHQERVSALEAAEEIPSDTKQAVSLADLLADTRVDFENLTQDELKTVYSKLLDIGMNGDLSASENAIVQDLVEEIEEMLPERGEYESAHELEAEADQGEEI